MTSEQVDTRQRGGVREFVDSVFWTPHANPRSAWALIATYPVLIAAVYRRSGSLLAVTAFSVVVNLVGVSPPKTDDAWSTRVVLGEQVWLERGVFSEKGLFGLTVVGAVVNLYTLNAAMKHHRGRTLVGTVVSVVLMFVFFERMVRLYDAYGDE